MPIPPSRWHRSVAWRVLAIASGGAQMPLANAINGRPGNFKDCLGAGWGPALQRFRVFATGSFQVAQFTAGHQPFAEFGNALSAAARRSPSTLRFANARAALTSPVTYRSSWLVFSLVRGRRGIIRQRQINSNDSFRPKFQPRLISATTSVVARPGLDHRGQQVCRMQ